MIDQKTISIEEYNYHLPNEFIAAKPADVRDESKLLCYKNGSISSHNFKDGVNLLPNNTWLIANNSRVINARITFFKTTGAKIEIFCLEPGDNTDVAIAMSQKNTVVWNCMIGGLKKWKEGKIYTENNSIKVAAELVGKLDGTFQVKFTWDGSIPFSDVLVALGEIPLPPYMNRKADEKDVNRYQTVYSKPEGSVAAPTAGLHFTEDVLNNLKNNGTQIDYLTLHVGAGTFKPVSAETMADHDMHAEAFVVELNLIRSLLTTNKTIITVGTTTVRTLESIYWLGVYVLKNENEFTPIVYQWDPYKNENQISRNEALQALITWMEKNQISSLNAKTSLLIAPGYKFKIVNGLFTNFHQPKSTLLLLVAALIGDNWKKVYQFAKENNYRFLSYGDSNLYLP